MGSGTGEPTSAPAGAIGIQAVPITGLLNPHQLTLDAVVVVAGICALRMSCGYKDFHDSPRTVVGHRRSRVVG